MASTPQRPVVRSLDFSRGPVSQARLVAASLLLRP
jgi:hypothetical protein